MFITGDLKKILKKFSTASYDTMDPANNFTLMTAVYNSGSEVWNSTVSTSPGTNMYYNLTTGTKHNITGEFGILHIMELSSLSASVLFLLATFFTYLCLPRQWTPSGCCIMNMCVTLATSQVTLYFGINKTDWNLVCKVTAAIAQFSWMSSFFWLCCIIIHNWWTVNYSESVTQKRQTCIHVVYMSFCWCVPLILVGITFIFDYLEMPLNPGIGEQFCFIEDLHTLMLLFVAPCILFLFISILLLVSTCANCCANDDDYTEEMQEAKSTLRWALIIEILMDATVCLRYLEFRHDMLELTIVSMCLSFVQSFTTFFALVILQKVCQSVCRIKCSRSKQPAARMKLEQKTSDKRAERRTHNGLRINEEHAAIYSKHHPYIRKKRENSSSLQRSLLGNRSLSSPTHSQSPQSSSSLSPSPQSQGEEVFV